MLAHSAHSVELDCVFHGPGVIPSDSISRRLFPLCVTPSQRTTSGACSLLWFNRDAHGLAGATGAQI